MKAHRLTRMQQGTLRALMVLEEAGEPWILDDMQRILGAPEWMNRRKFYNCLGTLQARGLVERISERARQRGNWRTTEAGRSAIAALDARERFSDI